MAAAADAGRAPPEARRAGRDARALVRLARTPDQRRPRRADPRAEQRGGPPGVRRAPAVLRPDARRRLTAAGRRRPGGLAVILESEAEYLPRMDRIVGLYEREAQAHVDWLQGDRVGGHGPDPDRPGGDRRVRPAARGRPDRAAGRRAARGRATTWRPASATGPGPWNGSTTTSPARSPSAPGPRSGTAPLVEQFSHVARTTAVGEMASGLAHELNQPLGAIANYAEGCLVALDSPPTRRSTRSAPSSTRSWPRPSAPARSSSASGGSSPATARPASRSTPTASSSTSRSSSATRPAAAGPPSALELAPDLPKLMGDPVQVQQVLVNLLRNALDALDASQPVEARQSLSRPSRAPKGASSSAFRTTGRGSRGTGSARFSTPISAPVTREWAWAWPSAGRSSRPIMGGSASNPSPGSARPSGSPSPPRVTGMTEPEPTVYIVDDDPDMRDSLHWLMTTVGLRAEVFASAAGVPRRVPPRRPRLPRLRRPDAGDERPRPVRGAGRPRRGDARDLHHGLRRRADGDPGDEVRGDRVRREAVQPPGAPRPGPARDQGRRRAPPPAGRPRGRPPAVPRG